MGTLRAQSTVKPLDPWTHTYRESTQIKCKWTSTPSRGGRHLACGLCKTLEVIWSGPTKASGTRNTMNVKQAHSEVDSFVRPTTAVINIQMILGREEMPHSWLQQEFTYESHFTDKKDICYYKCVTALASHLDLEETELQDVPLRVCCAEWISWARSFQT